MMRTVTRRATRDQLAKRDNVDLVGGGGGTITGGPREPIDLTGILERGSRGVSRGGAVSGAASQVVVSNFGATGRQDRGIALSDGSRISFSSVADAGILQDDDVLVTRDESSRAPSDDVSHAPQGDVSRAPGDDISRAPRDDISRAPRDDKVRVRGNARVLTIA